MPFSHGGSHSVGARQASAVPASDLGSHGRGPCLRHGSGTSSGHGGTHPSIRRGMFAFDGRNRSRAGERERERYATHLGPMIHAMRPTGRYETTEWNVQLNDLRSPNRSTTTTLTRHANETSSMIARLRTHDDVINDNNAMLIPQMESVSARMDERITAI